MRDLKTTGFIKAYRSFLTSNVHEAGVAVRACFFDLLLILNAPKGVFESNITELSEIWKVDRKTVRKVLFELEKLGTITVFKEREKVIISAPNWGVYQKRNSLKELGKSPHLTGEKSPPLSPLGWGKVPTNWGKIPTLWGKIPTSINRYANVKNNNKNIKNNNIYIPDLENQILQNAKNDFEIFWEKYPKKSGKQECFVWWQKNHKDLDFKKIMAGLDWYACCDRVTAGYCLDPIRFLKRSIWNDDPAAYNDKKRGNLPSPKGKYNV